MSASAIQAPVPMPPSVVAATPALDTEDAETLATQVDAAQRMTVNVFVNGRGPYPFAVDTGSDRTAVARSLSERLDLPDGKTATMHSMGGSGQISTAMIDRLQVGGKEVRDVRAPVLADRHIGVSGLLGVDGLADQRVEMDFIAGEMKIYPSKVVRERSEPGTIVVKARRKYGQLILVDADIDGEKVNVILDSGAQISVGNNALRRKLARKGKQGSVQPITLIDVAGRAVEAEMGVLPKMRVGGLRVEGLSIAWTEAHPFKMFGLTKKPAMLLGMDLLRTFERVSVDFGNKKVRFMPREQGRRGLASRDRTSPPPAVTGGGA
nr:retroviral-like aspartic protease family protein [Sphingomonas laterariae]